MIRDSCNQVIHSGGHGRVAAGGSRNPIKRESHRASNQDPTWNVVGVHGSVGVGRPIAANCRVSKKPPLEVSE